MEYWIEYVDGTVKIFKASSPEKALQYYLTKRDEVWDFGPIIEDEMLDSSEVEQVSHTDHVGGSNPPLATNNG